MAPEVLEMGSGNSSSDVYSMGIVMWEIATGDIPWSTWDRDDYLTFSQVCSPFSVLNLSLVHIRRCGPVSRTCYISVLRLVMYEVEMLQGEGRLVKAPLTVYDYSLPGASYCAQWRTTASCATLC